MRLLELYRVQLHQQVLEWRAQQRLTPGKGRAARTLEGNVHAFSEAVDQFTQQHRTAITELRRETAERVTRIGLGHARQDRGRHGMIMGVCHCN